MINEVNLRKWGEGEIFVSLSKSKCAAEGKFKDASTRYDKEVVTELVSILCAGYQAEVIASKK
ncbi:hypothetical protein [Photobacterium leiognathi]|uniref:hypothetical protein n=1 Tax=Photobacterium leiognathi TaxID=553611 RepID=UPI00298200CF|nr:hypothetical protein [Photobacterium leiognathi]